MILRLTTVGAALLLAACAGTASGPGPATASTNAKAAMCLLGPFMPAGSTTVTRAQMEAGIAAGFAQADLDGDGGLNVAELQRLNDMKSKTCDNSAYIDWSSSGRVPIDAYAARYRTAFDQADTNEDNIVTQEEINESVRKPPRKKRAPMPSATTSGAGGYP